MGMPRLPGPVAPFRVRSEGELTDHKRAATGVAKRPVHLACIITKDAKLADFLGHLFCLGLIVTFHRANEDEQAFTDLSGDGLIDSH